MTDILDTLADLDDEDFEADFADDHEMELEDASIMSEGKAREVTEAIRSAATMTFVLLAQAHEHQAHRALGYATWAEYVNEEFDMSAQRSYQLLDLSRVTNEIEAAVPEGTDVKLTEAQARDIKKVIDGVTEKIRSAVDEGEDPTDAIDRVVGEVRDQKRADEAAIVAKQNALADEEQQRRQQDLEDQADKFLEHHGPENITANADDDLVEMQVEGEGAGELSPENSMHLYNFFTVLAGLNALPEPDDFLELIPKNRRGEIDEQILDAVAWLNRFQTLWELQDE